MSVRIQLDRPHSYFTNLDLISGKVTLGLSGDETITAIVVKLEGESRTRLASFPQGGTSPYDRRDRPQTQLEVHKLLYKVSQVFPTPELQLAAPRNSSYTLPAGYHEYPFQFKLPLNNDCSNNNSMFTNLHVTGALMEVAKDTNRHVKQTLPPSLNGFPGEAEIHYYVKVTVQRAAFYKENYRETTTFKFFPIEPPRPPANRRESYARRQHQFSPAVPILDKPSLFRKQPLPKPATSSSEPPKITVDGRLPDPAIVTCNEPLPLRVLIKKLNQSSDTLFLQLLQLELIGYTVIRAHELKRQESSSWVIVSKSNMNTALGSNSSTSQPNQEVEIDNKLWNSIPIPNTVPPTFNTCNLSRHYILEIRIGLAYGAPGKVNPELSVQSLKMPVQVYSGIAPPAALLARTSHQQQTAPPPATLNIPHRPSIPISPSSSFHPGTPQTLSSPNAQFATAPPPPDDIPDVPPPSYEDAMADDLGPVDGPRRDYHQQPEAGGGGVGGDRKRGGWGGSDERLFS